MRLNRWLVTLVLFLSAGCSSSPASTDWDPAATASLEKEPAAMLASLDAGDFDGMMAKMDANPVVFDIDENNQPIKAEGMDQVKAMFDHYQNAGKEQGVAFKSTLVSSKAFATSSLGYCAIEFDQMVSAGGQTMGPIKFRGTLVARKVGNDWKWTHWHGSFREMPPMPVPIPEAGAPPKS